MKRCDVCHAEYADDLKNCPHCRTDADPRRRDKANLWHESDNAPAAHDPSDSSVDAFGTLPVDEIPAGGHPSGVPSDHDTDHLGHADLGASPPDLGGPLTGKRDRAGLTMTGTRRGGETEMAFPSEMYAEVHGDEANDFDAPEPVKPPPAPVAEDKPAPPPAVPDEDVEFGDSEGSKDVGASQVDLGSSGTFHGLTGVSITNVSQGAIETKAAPVEPPVEEPVIEAEEEEAVVAEEPEAPATKERKPGTGRPMLIGGVIGAIVGSAACFGLAIMNLLPVGSAPDKQQPIIPANQQQSAPITPIAAGPSAEMMLVSGEFQKALAEYQKAENPDPAGLTKRGLARWLVYAQQQAQANKPPSAADEAVVQARKDLADANSDEAKFWLSRIDNALALGQMNKALAKGGYLGAGKQTDPVKALEAALAAGKSSKGGSNKSALALAAIIQRLKKDQTVAAADPQVKDAAKAVDVLLQAKSAAETKLTAAETKLTSAETKAAEAQAAQKEADKALAEANREKKAAEEQLAELAKKSEAAHGTLQEVVKRLTAAKHLEPSADPADVLQSVDRLIASAAAKSGSTGVKTPKPVQTASPAPSTDQNRRERTTAGWTDPEGSERHYSAGVRFYWLRRYADAEREFNRAIESNDGDARYYYYRGLTELAQGQRDGALDSFRRAGRLEQDQRPPRELVSESLERVQGIERGLLNRYRP